MKKLLLLILLIPTFAISGPYETHTLLLNCSGESKVYFCNKYKDKKRARSNGCKEQPSERDIVEVTIHHNTRTKEELSGGWPEYPENKIPFYVEFDMTEGLMPTFDQFSIGIKDTDGYKKFAKEMREKRIAQGETISAYSMLYDKYARKKLIDSESSSKKFMGKWEEVKLQGDFSKDSDKTFLETTKNYFEIDRIRGTLKTKTVSKNLSIFDEDENGELIDVLTENEEYLWFEREFFGNCSKVSNEQKF